ncbi:hypothetical protein HPT27_01280 [Permianibacter sp. IMCC34836]|uniref:hypothetical protein n=1 Tax=Permianibacter fluminis TaxID=2738515 RepID=UPI0015566FE0|nr:hypothetical protein [Permianibacter fluminis]NQD35634.1 hypothetical protein [Permianibacter fluminis]
MRHFTLLLLALAAVTGCGRSPRPFHPASVYQPPEAAPACTDLGCPLGYVAAPPVLTVGEELQREFERCLASSASADCAHEAFAAVRKSQGLDKKAPTGTVTVRKQHDGNADSQ